LISKTHISYSKDNGVFLVFVEKNSSLKFLISSKKNKIGVFNKIGRIFHFFQNS
jgi:hypothetical protein